MGFEWYELTEEDPRDQIESFAFINGVYDGLPVSVEILSVLSVGEHTWYFAVFSPESSDWLVDSGTVIVLPAE